MANGNLGSYAVTLPNIFQAPGQALESATQQIERQTEKMADRALREQEMAERKAERDEAQMYRKMQTIQDLSDLSKYRTTSDVANAIGDKSAQDLRAKYIQKAQEGANPSDIMAEMGRDVSSVAQGMQAFKTESEMIEKRLADINKDLPNLDYGRAISDYRKEALGRRIKGSEFINPLEVPPSNFATQLENPDFLSIYARGGKTLTEAIQAPKGLEKSSIFVGTPMENVRYDAQLPFWKRPTFKPEEAPGGFLPKGVIPKLELKADVLPAEAIKGSAKVPFKVIDEEVFNTFTQNPAVNIELIQATRQQYPQYDTFNQVEKNYAKRNVLYNKLSEIDQSDFSAAASTRAPVTNINIPKEPTATVNVYPEIEKLVDSRTGGMAAPLNQLSSTTQGIILDFARKAKGDNQLSQSEIAIKRNSKGEISIYDFNEETGKIGTMIGPVSKLSVNLEANPSVKAKQELIKEGEKPKTYKYQGKTFTEQQLINAAKQSGMTLEEYKKALKL
jgi:hypothetical protein